MKSRVLNRRIGRRMLALWLLATASLAASVSPAADVSVGVDVAAERQVPLSAIDHSPWDALLNRHVDERGMVDYRSWKASPGDSRALDAYLHQLSHSSGEGSREEQLAFWINAYNALTIKGILREYPTTSIRNHTAKLFGYNIWKDLKLLVGGKPTSLDEMEHQILRKLGEPRIHFAIVCASIGCPRLLAEAYVPDRLDGQLTLNIQSFFADPAKFRYDATRRTIQISPIMKWFGEDFGDNQAAQMKRIAAYLPDPAAQSLAASGSASVSYLDYDWGLNDRRLRKMPVTVRDRTDRQHCRNR